MTTAPGDVIALGAFQAWIDAFARLVQQNRDHLTELDAAIGDADHGTNMERGMTAVLEALADKQPADPGALLTATGMTLVSKVGGASGPLFGTFFLRMGTALKTEEPIDLALFAGAVAAGVQGVVDRGKATSGDKTMYDALQPASETLNEAASAGRDPADAITAAADAARSGCAATTPMHARKGRASYLGERSVGHQDPGATSVALLFEAAAQAVGS